MMLRAEDAGWREDIGAIAMLDGAALRSARGDIDIDSIRSTVARRLHAVPRFRQLLRVPRWWLGRPLWVDATDFRIVQHVRTSPLPAGAGDAELLAEVERLRARPFDRSRPLWELWLLPGLTDGRVGVYVKLHHSMADGVAGVAQIVAFLDLAPTSRSVAVESPTTWRPNAEPKTWELFADNVRGLVVEAGRWLAGLAHPRRFVHDITSTTRMLRETIGQPPAPATSANRPIGRDRTFRLLRSRLDTFRSVGSAHAATVNDVLMTVVAGGYRALLEHRGESTDVELRASVPVSLHTEGADDLTNDDGMLFVPLPLADEDPARRLDVITAATVERKRHVNRPPTSRLLSTRIAQDQLWKAFKDQRWSNAYVANVPGSPATLYLVGAPLLEVFPVVPIMGNLTIGVGAMSYDGQFNLTVVADRGTCPDVDVFVDGMRSTLERLAAHAAAPAPATNAAAGRRDAHA